MRIKLWCYSKFVALFMLAAGLEIQLIAKPVHSSETTRFSLEEKQVTPEAYFVGELGEEWTFPSDHLPVGISVNGLHFASWNILNTDYLNHIEENTQGLKDSLILSANFYIDQEAILPLREEIVIEQILQLLAHPTFPRSVIGIQETGSNLWDELQNRIPEKFLAISTFPDDLAHGDVFLYDSEIFEFIKLESIRYECHPRNTIMQLDLLEKSSGQIYRFIQSHVPGGPILSEPAGQELANFVMNAYEPNMVIILGDMNRSPEYFLQNFSEAAESLQVEQPFKNAFIPYPTHINTHMEASWIDNIFYYVPNDWEVKVSDEDSFFSDVINITNLLYQKKEKK